jgi:beta-lactamase regulating signal transducer with metallopeptidase domain
VKRSRRVLIALTGLGLGIGGCDTVSINAVPAGPAGGVGSAVHAVALGLVFLGLVTIGIVVASITRQARTHSRLSKGLRSVARPAVIGGRTVGVAPGVRVALVAGFRRPTTYVSADVIATLTGDEIEAVMLHERHHELSHAPARVVVLTGADAVLGGVPLVSGWVAWARAQIEIDADRHAVGAGSTRQSIARAIVKLADPSTALPTSGFASTTDLRLGALLNPATPPSSRWTADVGKVVLLAGVVAIVCSAVPR